MRISELPLGSRIQFGTMNDEDLVWIKVSESNDFVTNIKKHLCFDYYEHASTTRDHRNGGNNFFFTSNICQYLNKGGLQWFLPAHENDTCSSSFAALEGFLSSFTTEEIGYLIPRSITLGVPNGSKKAFGRVCSKDLLVTIPSVTEVCQRVPFENDGEYIPYLSLALDALGISICPLRTAVVTTGNKVYSYVPSTKGIAVMPATSRADICPMIRVAGDYAVNDIPMDDGTYYRMDDVASSLNSIIFA